MMVKMTSLRNKLVELRDQCFMGRATAMKVRQLDALRLEFVGFYAVAVDYMEKWFKFGSSPESSWLLLSD